MEQKYCLRKIYKIHSKKLKRAKWNLTQPLETAMRDYPEEIVSLASSQLLRFIDEINGELDVDRKIKYVKNKIKSEKKKPRSRERKMIIKNLYSTLYELEFQPDYICIIMDTDADYDRANLGFAVNGINYKRFLGTNGGIKNSTIVYVNEVLYPELKKRLDNGRNKDVPLVPAKLEAYQALICSGSTPLPPPEGIIVVKDCITRFKDDVILISDSKKGEPKLEYVDGYDIEHNDSDGYGLMLPSYSRKVNEWLTGNGEHTIAGMNTRYAWTKGMVYTFDFIEFAEKVAGTYEIIDVWGDKRDIRDAEVILTESMLKLWNCYSSWEDYYTNCQKNNYVFATPKTTPEKLENVRLTNYQFLQSYELNEYELEKLCQPTVEELKDVLGMDYRKSLVFLSGLGLNDYNVFDDDCDNTIKALMAEPKLINDSYIRHKIWGLIRKRIEMAKRGAIRINANFAMISGDPYALCQSIFEMDITGLLKSGELYHKYWIDKGADELACFRAPMSVRNNIRRLKLNKGDDAAYWYRYIDTAIILNAFDTTCDALNGADKDGDTFMCTDNPILLTNTPNDKTIMCMQKNAEKKIPTEKDIIASNKIAFNDDIGIVTNHVTGMFERRAGYKAGTKEYEVLTYRIMCGQKFQQDTIDRAKGIIAKPMPPYWYSMRDNIPRDGDDKETIKQKLFNKRIAAAVKPYFMTYVYPMLRTQNNEYIKNSNRGVVARFGKSGIRNIDELKQCKDRTPEMQRYLDYYLRYAPVGTNDCLVNRICWTFEREFDSYLSSKRKQPEFDYSILKSGIEYTRGVYDSISNIYKEYKRKVAAYMNRIKNERLDRESQIMQYHSFIEWFKKECAIICSNEDELCDILIDICYKSNTTKQFVWDVSGDIIVRNLLRRNSNIIRYPSMVDNDWDFEYCGNRFAICEKVVNINNDNFE